MREEFSLVIVQWLSLHARAFISCANIIFSIDLFITTKRAVPWFIITTLLALLKLRQVVEVLFVVLIIAILFFSALPRVLGDGIFVD